MKRNLLRTLPIAGIFFAVAVAGQMRIQPAQVAIPTAVTNVIVDDLTLDLAISNLEVNVSNYVVGTDFEFYPATSNPSNYLVIGEGMPFSVIDTNFFEMTTAGSPSSNTVTGIETNNITGAMIVDDFLASPHFSQDLVGRNLQVAAVSVDTLNNVSTVVHDFATIDIGRPSLMMLVFSGEYGWKDLGTNAGELNIQFDVAGTDYCIRSIVSELPDMEPESNQPDFHHSWLITMFHALYVTEDVNVSLEAWATDSGSGSDGSATNKELTLTGQMFVILF